MGRPSPDLPVLAELLQIVRLGICTALATSSTAACATLPCLLPHGQVQAHACIAEACAAMACPRRGFQNGQQVTAKSPLPSPPDKWISRQSLPLLHSMVSPPGVVFSRQISPYGPRAARSPRGLPLSTVSATEWRLLRQVLAGSARHVAGQGRGCRGAARPGGRPAGGPAAGAAARAAPDGPQRGAALRRARGAARGPHAGARWRRQALSYRYWRCSTVWRSSAEDSTGRKHQPFNAPMHLCSRAVGQ